MSASPVITLLSDLYDVPDDVPDNHVLVKVGSVWIATDVGELGGSPTFDHLDDVEAVPGHGLWARQGDGSYVWTDPATFDAAMVATAVKTAGYAAAAGEFVPVDTSSASVTVTLPNAPADKTRVAVKHIIQGGQGANTVTVAAAGSDVFNKSGGVTSLTLAVPNQGVLLQYKSASHLWYVVADDLSLSQLDTRYQALAQEPPILQAVLSKLQQGNADADIGFTSDSTAIDATGDSTIGWVRRLAAWFNTNFPAVSADYNQWNSSSLAWPGSPTATYAGGGSHRVRLWNLSTGGVRENYGLSYLESQLLPKQLDALVIAYGHNDGTNDYDRDRYRDRILAMIWTALSVSPSTEIILVAQNPQVSPASGVGNQELLLHDLEDICRLTAASLVNVLGAFQEQIAAGVTAATLIDSTSGTPGIHPIDAGKQLWINAFTGRMTPTNRREGPRRSRPSALSIVGRQRITNGDFGSWPPDTNGWTLNNVTATQDSSVFEPPYTYSAKLAVTAAPSGFGAYISQVIPASALLGKYLTIYARIYRPSGQASTSLGKIGIESGLIDANHGLTDPSSESDCWVWEGRTVYIDPATTGNVTIYVGVAGSSALTAGDFVRVQQVLVVIGKEPRALLPASSLPSTLTGKITVQTPTGGDASIQFQVLAADGVSPAITVKGNGTVAFSNGLLSSLLAAGATGGTAVLVTRRAADSNSLGRWYVTSDGSINWTPGTQTADVTLRRAAQAKLQADAVLLAAGGLATCDINTTGLTSAQIDTAVIALLSPAAAMFDGMIISDKTNGLLLVRQNAKWCKTAALTVIT